MTDRAKLEQRHAASLAALRAVMAINRAKKKRVSVPFLMGYSEEVK